MGSSSPLRGEERDKGEGIVSLIKTTTRFGFPPTRE